MSSQLWWVRARKVLWGLGIQQCHHRYKLGPLSFGTAPVLYLGEGSGFGSCLPGGHGVSQTGRGFFLCPHAPAVLLVPWMVFFK